MSNIQIPNLPAVIALNGAEQMEAVQSGVSARLTVNQIAEFTASRYVTPGSAQSIALFGTDTASVDTPALQAAVDEASATGKTLFLYGTFRLEFDVSAPYFYAYSDPTRPVYPAIQITASNLNIIGVGARIRFHMPDDVASSIFAAFCTPQYEDDRSLENISFRNIFFDYYDDQGAATGWIQALYFVCTDGLTFENLVFSATPLVREVTITNNGSNQAVVTWPNSDVTAERAVIWFNADGLPPEMSSGVEYYAREPVTSDTFLLSVRDDGPLVTITPGTYTTTASLIRVNFRAIHLDNCSGTREINNTFAYGRQATMLNLCRNYLISGNTYHQIAEAVDGDEGVDGFVIADVTATSFFGEAQLFDMSPARFGRFDNIYANAVRTPMQLYTKSASGAGWPWLRKYKYRWAANFTIASPGVIQMVGAELFEGARFWIDNRPDTPGAVPPTGTALYTTYIVRNPVGDSCNFSLETDGPSGPLINITGPASLPPGVALYTWIIPDPATVLPSEDVQVSGMICDNMGTSTTRSILVGVYRANTPGVDRQQAANGAPVTAKNIVLRDIDLDGGAGIIVNECDGFILDTARVYNSSPGTTSTDAAVYVGQSIEDASAIAQSLFNGRLSNVLISNSQGNGLVSQAAANLTLENVVVDGWNLQNLAATIYAYRILRTEEKAGTYVLDRLETLNGQSAGATAPRGLTILSGGGPEAKAVAAVGPWRFRDAVAAVEGIDTDVGSLATSRMIVRIGPIDTTSGAVSVPIWSNGKSSARLIYASLVNLGAIVGDPTNYSTIILRKQTAGSSVNVSPLLDVDSAAVAADTERDFVVDGRGSNQGILSGSVLYALCSPVNAGSIIPAMTLELVLWEYAT